jgi:hypothetical protein
MSSLDVWRRTVASAQAARSSQNNLAVVGDTHDASHALRVEVRVPAQLVLDIALDV